MGMGQILGVNYNMLGFTSAEEMYDMMSDCYENQIETMISFIQIRGLDKGTIKELIKGYNGEGNVAAYEKLYNDAVW